MISCKALLRTASIIAACAMPAAAWAEDEAASDDNAIIVLGEANRAAASVATRVPVETMQTPFTITQVAGEVIEESAARSLSDALRYAGTVGGTDNFGNAGEFFSSRGFQLANGSNYFRDGLRYRKYGQVPLYDIECQSACKRDPLSARKRDPLSGWRNVDVTGFLALRAA